jgi:hypothetical protein
MVYVADSGNPDAGFADSGDTDHGGARFAAQGLFTGVTV